MSNDSLQHYGVLGMRWGHHKKQETSEVNTSSKPERLAYAVGAKVNPREMKYKARKLTNKVDANVEVLSEFAKMSSAQKGYLTTNQKSLKAIESVGIKAHSKKVYDNLDEHDLRNLKVYTDSARYSRSVNEYLAIGTPKAYATESESLKKTLKKNSIENQVVYRSCNMKFSVNGVAKKFDNLGEEEFQKNIDLLSKNFKGKTLKENRVFSTSTSPLFAIDTWRKVNPTAASTYNTYMIINCKGTPGVLADGKTKNGKSLVNTRSNQEAILAPNNLTYRDISYDRERQMYVLTVDAN